MQEGNLSDAIFLESSFFLLFFGPILISFLFFLSLPVSIRFIDIFDLEKIASKNWKGFSDFPVVSSFQTILRISFRLPVIFWKNSRPIRVRS